MNSWASLWKWFDTTWANILRAEQSKGFDSLTDVEKDFYHIYMLLGEVGNGGFDQYYFNSSGENTNPTLFALRKINAETEANLLDQCSRLFPDKKPPKEREERIRQLHSMDEKSIEFMNQASHQLMSDRDCWIKLYHYFSTQKALTDSELRNCYPELYQAERYFQEISLLPVEDQFHQLFNELLYFFYDKESDLKKMEISRFDIEDKLMELRFFDENLIISTIQENIYKKEFNIKGTSDFKKHGAFTKEANLVHRLLKILSQKAKPTTELQIILVQWLKTLYETSKNEKLAGLNTVMVARTLKSLWEIQYPDPIQGATDNKLLNVSEFTMSYTQP